MLNYVKLCNLLGEDHNSGNNYILYFKHINYVL